MVLLLAIGAIVAFVCSPVTNWLEDILNTRTDEIPMCFRKSVKSLKKLRKYVLNSLKYDYTNAMVEGKNNKIKVIKIPKTPISVGYSFNYLYLVVFALYNCIRIVIFQ